MSRNKSLKKTFTREDSDFMSKGIRCAGWLYRPVDVSNPPVVVMAHGFGGARAWGLPPFAEEFANRGMAVFLFDYRTFGDSDGEPRGLVSPRRHLQDYKEALSHVRNLPDIDTKRIALWGTSFSGGHAIVTASRDSAIKAIVVQAPFVDGITSTIKTGMGHAVKCIMPITKDVLRIFTGRMPYYMPLAANPDSFAIFNTPESLSGFMSIIPEGEIFTNECPARSLLGLLTYRPIAHASKVKCPALFVIAQKDSLIPPDSVEKTASRMSNAVSVHLDAGHFDVYTGKIFENVVKKEADFLALHLLEE